jgi:hypothetical protein
MKEETELSEAEGRQIVDKLKSTGEHEEAGRMAFKHGLGRGYGPHFGMRSGKYSAETAYHKGYDKAEFANRKKANEEIELDEISYRDSGAQNMMRASRKADKEADKVRAQAAAAAAKEAAKKK